MLARYSVILCEGSPSERITKFLPTLAVDLNVQVIVPVLSYCHANATKSIASDSSSASGLLVYSHGIFM